MLFVVKGAFLICTMYTALMNASSPTPISVTKFLSPERCSQVLSRFPKATLNVMELCSHRLAPHANRLSENSQQHFVRKMYESTRVVFGGVCSCAGFLLKGIKIAGDFVGKDVQMLMLGALVAGGFWQVKRRLDHHTELLGALQDSLTDVGHRVNGVSDQVTAVQGTLTAHGGQLTAVQGILTAHGDQLKRIEDAQGVQSNQLTAIQEKQTVHVEQLDGIVQSTIRMEGTLNDHKKQLTDLQDFSSASNTALNSRLVGLSIQLSTLDSQITGFGDMFAQHQAVSGQRFDAFGGRLDGISDRIQEGNDFVAEQICELKEAIDELGVSTGKNIDIQSNDIKELKAVLQSLSKDANVLAAEVKQLPDVIREHQEKGNAELKELILGQSGSVSFYSRPSSPISISQYLIRGTDHSSLFGQDASCAKMRSFPLLSFNKNES